MVSEIYRSHSAGSDPKIYIVHESQTVKPGKSSGCYMDILLVLVSSIQDSSFMMADNEFDSGTYSPLAPQIQEMEVRPYDGPGPDTWKTRLFRHLNASPLTSENRLQVDVNKRLKAGLSVAKLTKEVEILLTGASDVGVRVKQFQNRAAQKEPRVEIPTLNPEDTLESVVMSESSEEDMLSRRKEIRYEGTPSGEIELSIPVV